MTCCGMTCVVMMSVLWGDDVGQDMCVIMCDEVCCGMT